MSDNLIRPRASEITLSSGTVNPEDSVRVLISLNNIRCSGRYLLSICHWLENINIRDIDFQVSDTLQRFNLIWRNDIDERRAYVEAQALGDKWIDENRLSVDYCQKNFERVRITRWDFFLKHPEFRKFHSLIDGIYSDDAELKGIVDAAAVDYLNRARRSITDERIELSRKFLIEETAVDIMTSTLDPAVDIYPGSVFPVTDFILKHYKSRVAEADYRFAYISFGDHSQ